VLDWLLDSDPAIRWQVLRDLAGASAEVFSVERARVVSEGWGTRLLALQGGDGQWAGGALFPHGKWDRNEPQPWTATANSLALLQEFGIDPRAEKVRRAVVQVREHCRWEHAGQPFFSGEVEPCINGMVIALGAYFDQDVDAVVARLLVSSLGTADGIARRRTVRFALLSRARSESSKGCWHTNGPPVARRNPLRLAAGLRSTSSNGGCSGVRELTRWSIPPGCNSRFRLAGTTTCFVVSNTLAPLAIRQIRA